MPEGTKSRIAERKDIDGATTGRERNSEVRSTIHHSNLSLVNKKASGKGKALEMMCGQQIMHNEEILV